MARNVLGEELQSCSFDPLTGWFRDGCCNTDSGDYGVHTVCAVMTAEFLEFSKAAGNDLSTPQPAIGFDGLAPGDHWCLCAPRWAEAHAAGAAPQVVLEADARPHAGVGEPRRPRSSPLHRRPGLKRRRRCQNGGGPLAHRVEQETFNLKVPGSSPGRPTGRNLHG